MGFNWIDGLIVVAYLIAITLFGIHFRRKQQSIHTYFLGGKTIPAWALSLSIVATETSTLTVIGTPGIAFGGNLSFLQLVLGYLVGRVFISLVLIPAYFKGEMYTAYELMQRRFGSKIKHATASMFLITRALAEGVRVLAIATVVSVVLGTGDIWSILIISGLTLIYTFEGGLTAVIWTDVVQLFIYISGTLVAFFVILGLIPGGWQGVLANAGQKLTIWNFSTGLTIPYTFWAGIIGGAFLNTASHGVDQLIVQRLLAAKNERDSKVALLSSGLVILFQFTLFLIVGVMLQLLSVQPPRTRARHARQDLPHFRRTASPARCLRPHDCRDSRRRDGEPEQRHQLARFHDRGGLLSHVCDRGSHQQGRAAALALDHSPLGSRAGLPRDPVTRRPVGPGGRTHDRFDHLRQHAGRIPARRPDPEG